MKVENTSNQSCDKVKMIVYGRAGSGKTTLVKTLPGRSLVVSAESGLLPLRKSKIDYIDITKDDDGRILPEISRRGRLLEAYAWIIGEGGKGYDWIVLDSFSEICEIVVAEMRYKYDIVNKKERSYPMYQEVFHILRMIAKSFRDLPFNVMITCLSEKDHLGEGKFFHSIFANGRIKKALAGMFDLVLYLHAPMSEERQLVCRENQFTESKDRTGKLEMVMPSDISLAINKIYEGEEKRV